MTKIIDCTLRDGGYLTNWNFDINYVRELYNTANDTGIEYLECGYRNFCSETQSMPFYFCDDDFLFSTFNTLKNTKLALMADVGKSDLSLFKKCHFLSTPVSLVRVAVYPDKLSEALKFCEGLKGLNYDVMLNLMAFGKYAGESLEFLHKWENKDILKSVCFADSFGAFYPEDIEKYANILYDIGFKNVSFHAHNNLQLAFANSLKADEQNFFSVDASVCGVGRSAGILPIELIIGCKYFNEKYNILPYLNFINKNMSEMTNLTAIIGGIKNVHPNYLNELFAQNKGIEEIWKKTEKIAQKGVISFCKSR